MLSSRQWHPQPVGHTSCVRNHSIIWLVWPPWPHVRQKLEEPRTATWQMAHWKVKPLQMAHWVPRTSLRQWLQYTPNSAPRKKRRARQLVLAEARMKKLPPNPLLKGLPQASFEEGDRCQCGRRAGAVKRALAALGRGLAHRFPDG